jgi:hypothetical protein
MATPAFARQRAPRPTGLRLGDATTRSIAALLIATCTTGRLVGNPGVMSGRSADLLCRDCGSRRCACSPSDPRRVASAPGSRSRGRAATLVNPDLAPGPDDQRERAGDLGPLLLYLRDRQQVGCSLPVTTASPRSYVWSPLRSPDDNRPVTQKRSHRLQAAGRSQGRRDGVRQQPPTQAHLLYRPPFTASSRRSRVSSKVSGWPFRRFGRVVAGGVAKERFELRWSQDLGIRADKVARQDVRRMLE